MDPEHLRSLLARALLSVVGRRNRWRTAAVLLAILSYKNLPGVWHIRFFTAAIIHTIRAKAIPLPLTSSQAFPLFLPVISATRSPLLECDYNIHKSNSTYFSDLDISRTHLISLLGAPGIKDYHARRSRGEKALLIALGGVACFFSAEIKPYEPYEMWTRTLAWDHKWVYTVTHFVRRGAVQPAGYLMQPRGPGWWSSLVGPRRRVQPQKGDAGEGEAELVNGAGRKDIFAVAISKYVFKSGRKTTPPELIFQRCGLLPEKPAGAGPGGASGGDEGAGGALGEGPDAPGTPESLEEVLLGALRPGEPGAAGWTWEMVERERLRGMEIARHMGELEAVKMEFTGDSKPALGVYRDLLFA